MISTGGARLSASARGEGESWRAAGRWAGEEASRPHGGGRKEGARLGRTGEQKEKKEGQLGWAVRGERKKGKTGWAWAVRKKREREKEKERVGRVQIGKEGDKELYLNTFEFKFKI
jgi:hypothetical protein